MLQKLQMDHFDVDWAHGQRLNVVAHIKTIGLIT